VWRALAWVALLQLGTDCEVVLASVSLVIESRPVRRGAGANNIRKQVFFFQKCILRGNGSNDHSKMKSENGFMKQNQNLVLKYGFRFSLRASEQTGFPPLNYENSGFQAQIPRNWFFCSACSDARTENLELHL